MKNKITKANRDEQHALRRVQEKVQPIWERWKNRFINRPSPVEEWPSRLNDLAADIRLNITEDHPLIEATIAQIYQKVADVKAFSDFMKFAVIVNCVCDNKVSKKDKRTGVSIIGDCGWMGVACVRSEKYSNGTAQFECPQCKKLLTADQMHLPVKQEERK